MAVNRDISRRSVVVGRFDDRNHAPLRKIARRNLLPTLPAIGGDVDQAIIGAGPQQAFRQRRLSQRKHGVVILDTGDV